MEAVKKVLKFLFSLFSAYSTLTANGRKIKWTDFGMLGPVLYALPEAMNSLKEAGEQWENGSSEDRAKIIAFLKEDFDIADDNLEEKIEAALIVLVKAGGMYHEVMDLIASAKVLFAKKEVAQIAAAPEATV